VSLYKRHASDVRLAILDLTMPRMDGQTASIELHKIQPDLPIIIASGFSETDAATRFSAHPPAGFLQKPFKLKQLVALIRSVLSSRAVLRMTVEPNTN